MMESVRSAATVFIEAVTGEKRTPEGKTSEQRTKRPKNEQNTAETNEGSSHTRFTDEAEHDEVQVLEQDVPVTRRRLNPKELRAIRQAQPACSDEFFEYCEAFMQSSVDHLPTVKSLDDISELTGTEITAALSAAESLIDSSTCARHECRTTAQGEMSKRLEAVKNENAKKKKELVGQANRYIRHQQAENKKVINTMRGSIHAGNAGNSNLASPFPLSQEIVSLSKKISGGDLSEVLLDHLIIDEFPVLKAVRALRSIVEAMVAESNQCITEAKGKICAAIGVDTEHIPPRLQNMIGDLRREQWRHFCYKLDEQLFQNWVSDNCPEVQHVMRSKVGVSAMMKFVNRVVELQAAIVLSNPPLGCDWKAVGKSTTYDSSKCEALDGTVKPNEQCIILWPSISIEGTRKTRQLVLPADYVME